MRRQWASYASAPTRWGGPVTTGGVRSRVKVSWWRIVLAGLLFVVAITVVPAAMWLITRIAGSYPRPEESLPALLISGVVALLIALAGLIVLFTAAGLEDRRAALGMPEGSIRAVIALMLILLFSIMAIFLYGTLRFGSDSTYELARTNAAAADALAASEDIARQLLTTVGTLVVAIAAFYFGSNSVASATSAVARESGSDVEQLERLAAMRAAGTLTDEEFATLKARTLEPGRPTAG